MLFARNSANSFLRVVSLHCSSFLFFCTSRRNSRARSRLQRKLSRTPDGSFLRYSIHAFNSSESAITGLRRVWLIHRMDNPLRSQRCSVRTPYRRWLEISFHPVRIMAGQKPPFCSEIDYNCIAAKSVFFKPTHLSAKWHDGLLRREKRPDAESPRTLAVDRRAYPTNNPPR